MGSIVNKASMVNPYWAFLKAQSAVDVDLKLFEITSSLVEVHFPSQ